MVGHAPQKSGKLYNCHYHNPFWLRDGKISAVKEYLDTYHAGEVLDFHALQGSAIDKCRFDHLKLMTLSWVDFKSEGKYQ
jgi:hypothetical protein